MCGKEPMRGHEGVQIADGWSRRTPPFPIGVARPRPWEVREIAAGLDAFQ